MGLVLGATLVNALTSRTPASGRALLREIRASFYRTLFLAFVAAAVVPVVILAIAIRTYFTTQLRAGIEGSGGEDRDWSRSGWSKTMRRCSSAAPGRWRRSTIRSWCWSGAPSIRMSTSSSGSQLRATSERDLFASGLLPTRTPADVYRRIVLDRLPTFVGEEQDGDALSAGRRAGPRRRRGRDRDRAGHRCASRKSNGRSTISIARCCRWRCCSACSVRRSAIGWRNGSPIRSTG